MHRADMENREIHVDFEIPENAAEVYLVVLGAADKYAAHPWDEKEINDAQAPYKVKIAPAH